MVQFTDVLAVTQAGGIDWSQFVERAIEHQAAPFALAALTLGQRCLGVQVPDSVLIGLRGATSAALQHHIEHLSLDDILKRSQQKPVNTLTERIQRGYQDRAATAVWASDTRTRWQVWRTLIDVTKTDTGRLLMGKTLKEKESVTINN